MWVETWRYPPGLPLVPNPCQSTGVWYLEPTPPTVDFLRASMERIAYHHIYEWEQTAWNDVLIHFLWGAGDYEPVKYRNLPLSEFANLESYKSRKSKGMPMNTIVVHMEGSTEVKRGKNFRN